MIVATSDMGLVWVLFFLMGNIKGSQVVTFSAIETASLRSHGITSWFQLIPGAILLVHPSWSAEGRLSGALADSAASRQKFSAGQWFTGSVFSLMVNGIWNLDKEKFQYSLSSRKLMLKFRPSRYSWPLAMQGYDVIGVAATGSGKTPGGKVGRLASLLWFCR